MPCDRLPKRPNRSPRSYIVNTDPHDQPGQHWLGLWTYNNVCEVMDSYALPLESYEEQPLIDWIEKYWKYVMTNGKSLQAVQDQSCGHYALIYLKEKARGRSLQDFLTYFPSTITLRIIIK